MRSIRKKANSGKIILFYNVYHASARVVGNLGISNRITHTVERMNFEYDPSRKD